MAGSQPDPGLDILEHQEVDSPSSSPVTTPVAALTIGTVIDLLPKLKNGTRIDWFGLNATTCTFSNNPQHKWSSGHAV